MQATASCCSVCVSTVSFAPWQCNGLVAAPFKTSGLHFNMLLYYFSHCHFGEGQRETTAKLPASPPCSQAFVSRMPCVCVRKKRPFLFHSFPSKSMPTAKLSHAALPGHRSTMLVQLRASQKQEKVTLTQPGLVQLRWRGCCCGRDAFPPAWETGPRHPQGQSWSWL